MMKKSYEIALVLSQVLSAIIMLICINGKATVWMYIVLIIPPLLLIAILFLERKFRSLTMVPFWLIFIICFAFFWFNPNAISLFSFNEYSITAIVFLLLNTIFCIVAPHTKPNPFFGVKTAEESPEIWAKVHSVFSVVCSTFEIPLLLLIFFIPGKLKFGLCIAFLLSAVLGGWIIGQISVTPLLKQLRHQEEEELKAAIREEQNYRK